MNLNKCCGPAGMSSRTCFFLLTGIFLLGFICKIIPQFSDLALSRDGCLYVRLLQEWYDTGNFFDELKKQSNFYLLPFPFFLIKGLMYFGMSAETAGLAFNIFLGTLLPLVFYGIAFEITQDKRTALVSALLAAVHPTITLYAENVERDMPYLFFAGLTILFLCMAYRCGKWYYWVPCGFFFSCSFLSRYETLELLPVILFLLVGMYLLKRISGLKIFLCLFVFLGIFALSVFLLEKVMGTENYLYWQYSEYFHSKFTKIAEKSVEP